MTGVIDWVNPAACHWCRRRCVTGVTSGVMPARCHRCCRWCVTFEVGCHRRGVLGSVSLVS